MEWRNFTSDSWKIVSRTLIENPGTLRFCKMFKAKTPNLIDNVDCYGFTNKYFGFKCRVPSFKPENLPPKLCRQINNANVISYLMNYYLMEGTTWDGCCSSRWTEHMERRRFGTRDWCDLLVDSRLTSCSDFERDWGRWSVLGCHWVTTTWRLCDWSFPESDRLTVILAQVTTRRLDVQARSLSVRAAGTWTGSVSWDPPRTLASWLIPSLIPLYHLWDTYWGFEPKILFPACRQMIGLIRLCDLETWISFSYWEIETCSF